MSMLVILISLHLCQGVDVKLDLCNSESTAALARIWQGFGVCPHGLYVLKPLLRADVGVLKVHLSGL